jgi:hypothetical protein
VPNNIAFPLLDQVISTYLHITPLSSTIGNKFKLIWFGVSKFPINTWHIASGGEKSKKVKDGVKLANFKAKKSPPRRALQNWVRD